MYRLHLNFTHLESHKAKVITILLQPALHRRGGQDAQQNVCQIKNTFAAALNSTSKKHMRTREGESAGRRLWLIRHLNEGKKIWFSKEGEPIRHMQRKLTSLIWFAEYKE